MATFKVGQKVTCVNDRGFVRSYSEQVPVLGRNYTVRAVVGPCVRLTEIVNPAHDYATGHIECSFLATRFAAKRGK